MATAKNTGDVKIKQNVTTVISSGNDNYTIKATEDGRGVHVENGQGSLFLPLGAVGKAIVNQLNKELEVKPSGAKRGPKPKAKVDSTPE